MVKCGVFFAVRTEFLNVIWMSFGLQMVNMCVQTKEQESQGEAALRNAPTTHTWNNKPNQLYGLHYVQARLKVPLTNESPSESCVLRSACKIESKAPRKTNP
jgi:hypothetical protein